MSVSFWLLRQRTGENNLKEERVILCNRFRSLGPWSLGLLLWACGKANTTAGMHGRAKWLSSGIRKARSKTGRVQDKHTLQSTPPVCLSSSPCLQKVHHLPTAPPAGDPDFSPESLGNVPDPGYIIIAGRMIGIPRSGSSLPLLHTGFEINTLSTSTGQYSSFSRTQIL